MNEQTRTVTLTRSYSAPPTKLWAAWADVDLLSKWWGCGPNMLWNVHTWDFQVDGEIHVSLDFDGNPFEVKGQFRELDEPHHIAYDWQDGQVITVTISPDGDGSTMTIEHGGLPGEEMVQIVTRGWSSAVEQILTVLA